MLLVMGDGQASANEREEALQAAESNETSEQLRAAILLQREALPGDEPVIIGLAGSGDSAVSSAAIVALGQLGTQDALAWLESELRSGSSSRREAAGLAIVRSGPDTDPKLVEAAVLQVTSPSGQKWVSARETYLKAMALQDKENAAMQAVADAARDPQRADCIAAELRTRGVLAESFDSESLAGYGSRAERFWREGRLSMLPGELARLESVVAAADQLDVILAACQPGDGEGSGTGDGSGDGTSDGNARSLPGSTPRRRGMLRDDMLLISATGGVGHDNNTFQMNPALSVTAAGPQEGTPIDLVRDDTIGFGMATISWIRPLAELPLIMGLRERPQILRVDAWGGYLGRLRWGQIMGPMGGADLLWDDVLSDDDRLRVEASGETRPANWWDEFELTEFPFQRAGGEASVEWYRDDRADRPVGFRDLVVGYHGQGWTAVGEPRVQPPEDWFTEHEVHGYWLDEETGLGAGGNAAGRVSEGTASGGVLSAFGRFARIVDNEHLFFVELGYGAGVPFDDATGQVELGDDVVELDNSWQHGPWAGGGYRYVEWDSDIRFEVDLQASSRLEPGGRYGWAGQQSETRFRFAIFNELDLLLLDFGLLGRWGQMPYGDLMDSDTGEPTDREVDVDVVAGAFWFEFPVYFDDWLFTGFRSEGRLTSDTTRFDGKLKGQFRIFFRTEIRADVL